MTKYRFTTKDGQDLEEVIGRRFRRTNADAAAALRRINDLLLTANPTKGI